jgi:GH15 family glucan-1,4-alpha-glucosidase
MLPADRGNSTKAIHSPGTTARGVDRAIRDVELFGFDGPVDRWRALRQEIHDEVCREGFDADLGSFTQA